MYGFFRPAEVNVGVFRFTALALALRPASSVISPRAPRVKGGRYRGFRTKYSKPCIKRRIERAFHGRHTQRGRERDTGETEDEGEEEATEDRERKRGREPIRGSIRLYSKRGTAANVAAAVTAAVDAVASAASVGYDDEVIPSVLPPSGSDVTSRCNKHEYKWFLRPVPTARGNVGRHDRIATEQETRGVAASPSRAGPAE